MNPLRGFPQAFTGSLAPSSDERGRREEARPRILRCCPECTENASLSPCVLQRDRTATAPSLDAMPVQAMPPAEQRACQRVRHEFPRELGRENLPLEVKSPAAPKEVSPPRERRRKRLDASGISLTARRTLRPAAPRICRLIRICGVPRIVGAAATSTLRPACLRRLAGTGHGSWRTRFATGAPQRCLTSAHPVGRPHAVRLQLRPGGSTARRVHA